MILKRIKIDKIKSCYLLSIYSLNILQIIRVVKDMPHIIFHDYSYFLHLLIQYSLLSDLRFIFISSLIDYSYYIICCYISLFYKLIYHIILN